MKRVIGLVLPAALLVFSNAFAQDTSGNTSAAAQEWRPYVEPLLPLGERMTTLMSDPQDSQLRQDSQDPQLRQETYRFAYSLVAQGYMALLYANAEHPDFWPIWNAAFNLGFANPDDVYYLTPLQDDGGYKISGFRGTTRIVDFQVGTGLLIPYGTGNVGPTLANYDLDKLHIGKDGSFEVILSPVRPTGYKGDWWKLDAKATYLLVRQISYDWLHEVDGRFAIERLDRPAIKPRPSAQELEANLRQIPVWADTWTKYLIAWVNRLHNAGLINKVRVNSLSSTAGLTRQQYIEGTFDLAADDALIIETVIPKQCRYWSIELTDDLLISIDWINRQTSLNGHTAKIDKDGRFRAVISATDPGVPNWLDTAGYNRGVIYGRWTECSSTPTPTVTKVKLADVRKYLPAETPVVSAEARDASIRLRRKGAQLRRRW